MTLGHLSCKKNVFMTSAGPIIQELLLLKIKQNLTGSLLKVFFAGKY